MLRRVAARLTSNPLIYQVVQTLLGQRVSVRQLQVVMSKLPRARVLDIGSSAGAIAREIFDDTVSLDIDPVAVIALKQRNPAARAVVGSASALPFRSRSFATAACIFVSHHLDDPTAEAAFDEAGRVVRSHFVFCDAVRNDRRWLSRLLWRYDRGRDPRTRDRLLEIFDRRFSTVQRVDYAAFHQYLLCVGSPRSEPK